MFRLYKADSRQSAKMSNLYALTLRTSLYVQAEQKEIEKTCGESLLLGLPTPRNRK
jgi:hypothetical protein